MAGWGQTPYSAHRFKERASWGLGGWAGSPRAEVGNDTAQPAEAGAGHLCSVGRKDLGNRTVASLKTCLSCPEVVAAVWVPLRFKDLGKFAGNHKPGLNKPPRTLSGSEPGTTLRLCSRPSWVVSRPNCDTKYGRFPAVRRPPSSYCETGSRRACAACSEGRAQ